MVTCSLRVWWKSSHRGLFGDVTNFSRQIEKVGRERLGTRLRKEYSYPKAALKYSFRFSFLTYTPIKIQLIDNVAIFSKRLLLFLISRLILFVGWFGQVVSGARPLSCLPFAAALLFSGPTIKSYST